MLLMLLVAAAVPAAFAQQAARVSGTVTDADTGDPLAGASVVLTRPGSVSHVRAAATDFDGAYTLVDVPAGEYVLTVSYVGFSEHREDLRLAAGQNASVDVSLVTGDVGLDDVVVTASRRQEKALEAPASVSVLNAEEIESQVTVSSVDVLRNTTGVDIAQTGIDRQEVVLRGFNNAFSGAAYVLTDYRQGAIASLGVNAYNMMPISNIDLERIEVVRGPGSALYGPGVDAGVIHFITKDPFTSPGTTVAVSGGEHSYFAFQGRHAGVLGDRFGYKLTGQYSQADDWALDPEGDELDSIQAAIYHSAIPRDNDVSKLNLNGALHYRFSPSTSLVGNVGYATANSVFLSGIGTLQANGFGYTYGQLRFTAGDFFAQGYVNKNDAGESFVYASEASALSGQSVVDESVQYVLQAQQGWTLLRDRQRFTLGADFESTAPETNGTITGRNEEDDTIIEYGVYGQSESELTEALRLTLAARLDYDNIYEEVQLSPRAALVFSPTPQHSLRATYNRAFSSPGTNSLFLDITARDRLLVQGAPFHLLIQARGAADGFTFNNYRNQDPTIGNRGLFSLPVPNVFGQSVSLGNIPLAPVYGVAAAGGLVTYLASSAPLPPPFSGLNAQQRGLLAQLLGYTAQQGSLGAATTDGIILGLPDEADPRGFRDVSGPVDIAPLSQTVTQTVELGYKGLVMNRFALAVDGYYTQKKNFVGPLLIGSPFAYLQTLPLAQDVGVALGTLFGTTTDDNVRGLLQQLQQQGVPPAQVAQILAGLVGGALNNLPAAVVQPDQQVLPGNDPNAVGGFLTYRNFGDLNYFGADVSAEYFVDRRLTLFGNLSWVSDNFFTHDELGEENEDLQLSLNAPDLKARLGFGYAVPESFSFSAAGRYTEGYVVQSGPYSGDIDEYFVLDLGAGYDFARFAPGLRLDVTVQNVLDNEHREFIGAPKIGRLALARLTYTLR